MPKLKTKKIAIIFIVIGGLFLGVWQLGLIVKKESKDSVGSSIPVDKEFSAPSVYHIKDAPFYGEKNWCWGSSAMMLLMDAGLTDKEIQDARAVIKNQGRGGPPDMFIAFQKYGLADNVRIAYSKNYRREYADFYNRYLLKSPKEQVILFNNKDEALNKLKELVSSDHLVMIVGHHGNHYMVVTGYDENYIYLNDPGSDEVFFQKVDYQKKRPRC